MRMELLSRYLLLPAFLLIGGIVTAPAQDNDCAAALTDKENGRDVCLQKGKRICLRLNARLATGFGWKVTKIDTGKLQLVSESTEKVDEDEAGREIQIFEFKAIAQGEVELELTYARPWEKEKPPAKRYGLRVIIY